MIGNKSLCDYALDYAARGWSVFPCNPSDKKPYVAANLDAEGKRIPGTGGFYKATRDAGVINNWWMRWPHAMIGVRMGSASGVWALDPDAPEGDKPDGRLNWRRLASKLSCPHTHAHVTPGGGRHLLFKWRPDRPVGISEGQLKGLGINVRGNGGYLIAPPSARHDGKAYEVEEPLDFFNFAEAPEWLYQLILPGASISQRAAATVRRPPTAYTAGRRIRGGLGNTFSAAAVARQIEGILRAIGTAQEGDRNKLVYWGARRLAEMVDQSIINQNDAYTLAVEAGVVTGLPRSEASRTVDSAFKGSRHDA